MPLFYKFYDFWHGIIARFLLFSPKNLDRGAEVLLGYSLILSLQSEGVQPFMDMK